MMGGIDYIDILHIAPVSRDEADMSGVASDSLLYDIRVLPVSAIWYFPAVPSWGAHGRLLLAVTVVYDTRSCFGCQENKIIPRDILFCEMLIHYPPPPLPWSCAMI